MRWATGELVLSTCAGLIVQVCTIGTRSSRVAGRPMEAEKDDHCSVSVLFHCHGQVMMSRSLGRPRMNVLFNFGIEG
jgi:hypothetical protein